MANPLTRHFAEGRAVKDFVQAHGANPGASWIFLIDLCSL